MTHTLSAALGWVLLAGQGAVVAIVVVTMMREPK
jgi:hypothetical protein